MTKREASVAFSIDITTVCAVPTPLPKPLLKQFKLIVKEKLNKRAYSNTVADYLTDKHARG